MYAVDFTDSLIHPINGVNDYEFRNYQKFQTFEEAKKELICYWSNMKADAQTNIANARKLKSRDCL